MTTHYNQLAGMHVLLGATTVEQTGITAGHLYEFTANGGSALVRWGAGDAATADAGFDFCVPQNGLVRAYAPAGTTAVNIIEANAISDALATVTIADVQIK